MNTQMSTENVINKNVVGHILHCSKMDRPAYLQSCLFDVYCGKQIYIFVASHFCKMKRSILTQCL